MIRSTDFRNVFGSKAACRSRRRQAVPPHGETGLKTAEVNMSACAYYRLADLARINKAEAGRTVDRWGWDMRYVIGVCLVTGFLIWDAASNDGRALNYAIRELRNVLSIVGG